MKPSDEKVIAVVETMVRAQPERAGADLWSLQAAFPDYPKKVVQRALGSLVQRQKLVGCACGCRGYFRPV